MRYLILIGAFFAFCGMASGTGSNQKCDLAQWTCGLGSFSACVEQMKYYDPNKVGPNGAVGGWSVNPNSPEFKACEASKKAECLKKQGC